MGVGAAEAEGVDPGPARPAVRGPLPQLGVDIERAVREVDVRVRRLEIEARRDLLVLEGQHRLDQAGDAGRAVQVADVGLRRADRAELAAVGVGAEGLGQRRHLDGVAERGAGAVGLHVAQGLGVDAGHLQHRGDHCGLAVHAGRRVARLDRAVVVDRRALDDGEDRVAVGEGVGEPLQDDDADAVAEDDARGTGVEGPDVPVARTDPPLLEEVAADLRQDDRHAAGQGHVALAVDQRLAGEVSGHQRGGAEGLHRQARTAQVQLVGDLGGDRVFLVADQNWEGPHRLDQLGVGVDVGHIGADAAAGIDADQAVETLGVVTGELEGLPGAFQEESVLRVHQLRVARRVAEEGGVELLDALEDGPGADVVWVAQQLGVGAGGDQLFVGEEGDGLASGAQVLPQLVDVPGPRKAAGHGDDGDVALPSVSPPPRPPPRVGRRLGGELPGEGAHRRRLEEGDGRDLDVQLAVDIGDHLHAEEGVAAEIEEVLLGADIDAEVALPDTGDPSLQLVAGRPGRALAARPGAGRRRDCRLGRRPQRLSLHPLVEAGLEVAGGHHQVPPARSEDAAHRLDPLFRRRRQLDQDGADPPGGRRGRLVGPAVPVDADPWRSAGAVVSLGEGVHEAVGRGVCNVAQTAQDRGDRGVEQAEVDLQPGERALQRVEAVGLGMEVQLTVLACRPRHRLEDVGAEDAGGVNHAVEGAEALDGVRHEPPHRRLVGHVDAGHHDLRPQRLDLTQAGDEPRGAVLRAVPGDPAVPILAGGQRRAAGEDELGLRRARQVARQDQADAAGAAGDQVDPPCAEDRPLVPREGRQREWLERLHPTLAATVGHHRRRRRRQQLGEEMRDLALGAFPFQCEVDGMAGEVRVLLRDHQAGAEEGRHLGAQALLAAHALHTVGDHVDAQRPRKALAAEGLDEGDQAVITDLLGAPKPLLAQSGLLAAGEPSQMHDATQRLAPPCEVVEQGRVVVRLSRADQISAVGGATKGLAGSRQDDVGTLAGEVDREPPCHAGAVAHQEPGRPFLDLGGSGGRGPPPPWQVEPVADVRLARHPGAARRGGRRDPVGLDPVGLAFEGVGRQRHPPPPLAGMEGPPVDRRARYPELAEGGQEDLRARPPAVRRAHGGDHQAPSLLVAVGVQAGERAEALPRAHLEEDPLRRVAVAAQQLAQALGEAHRSTHVARPVAGVGGLGGGDPGAGDVREIGDLRRPALGRPRQLGERAGERLQHRRVEGVGGGEAAADDAVGRELPRERRDPLLRSRRHGDRRAVQGGERQAVPREERRDRHRGERHRGHRPRRQLLDQPRPAGHQPQGVGQGEHAGQAGGHVLADAVADQRLRPDPPLQP